MENWRTSSWNRRRASKKRMEARSVHVKDAQDHEHNMQIVCPCIPFHREHFDYMKRCWCGLFIHKDVTDPDSLPQIPYAEFRKATNADRGGEDR